MWSGRNKWAVKDLLYTFWIQQLCRFKQELLFAADNAEREFRHSNVEVTDEEIQQIRKEASDRVEYEIKSSDDFVKTFTSEDWKRMEPFSMEEIEPLIEALYRFVELSNVLEQIFKMFTKENYCQVLNQPNIQTLVRSHGKAMYDNTIMENRRKRDENKQSKKTRGPQRYISYSKKRKLEAE